MKKCLFFAAIAVAAIAVSCNKIEQPANETVFTTTFTGQISEQTKTYLDPETFQVKFNKNDQFMTWAVQHSNNKFKVAKSIYVNSGDGVEPVTFGAYSYTGLSSSSSTFYCAGTYQGSGKPGFTFGTTAADNYVSWTMPATQIIRKDKGPTVLDDKSNVRSCLLLASGTKEFDAPQSEVNLEFKHILAYGNLKITNFPLDASDAVKTIKLSSSVRDFRGSAKFYPINGTIAVTPAEYKNVTLDVSNLDTATGTFDVLFTLIEQNFGNTTLSFEFKTNNGITKKCDIKVPAEKANFQTGHLLPVVIDCSKVSWK